MTPGFFFGPWCGRAPNAVQRVGSGGLVGLAEVQPEAMFVRISQAANVKVVNAQQGSNRRLPTIFAQPQD